MKDRCYNSKHSAFRNYGGKGIKICERWKTDFSAFLADMGPRPAGKTLDRIDAGQHYSPENCRWATALEQARNLPHTQLIEHEGKMISVSEFARANGVKQPDVHYRMTRYGLSAKEAVEAIRSLRPTPAANILT